jgi:LemA protein
MLSGLLTFVGLAIALIWLIATYNHLSALRQRLKRAWSSLDALARERHDELTKLVDLCAAPLGAEPDALARLDEARTALLGARNTQDPEALGRAEGTLRERLAALLALAARTPAVASAPAFAQIKERLATLDAQIAGRREEYNGVVLENNIAIEQFPQRVVAGIAGLRPMALLEFTSHADAGRPGPG